jgi:hypothetical protein
MPRKRLLLSLSIACLGFPALVIGQIQPSTPILGSFQQQQFTLPGYQDVSWLVEPKVGMGTITANGLYTAPDLSAYRSDGVIFIYAQPAGGPLFATIAYLDPTYAPPPGTVAPPAPTSAPTPPVWTWPGGPSPGPTPFSPLDISVSVSPASINLQAGQSAAFIATVQGTNNELVQWTLNPNLGSIVNGVYTAPSSVVSDAQVTVSATSLADSTKTATATVLLSQPITPVSISVAPNSMTLSAGQSVQFTAAVFGSTNTAVNWSLNPNTGSINNGFYTAPSNLTSQQTITLTATSQADPTRTASAWLILRPIPNPIPPAQTVSISLWPWSASLNAGQSATFTASITGSSNTAVTWSLSPAVGTIVNGVYTAPATIASSQAVTVTAASVADPTKTAAATVTVQSAANGSDPSATTITLPIEVMGQGGTTVTVPFNVPPGTDLTGQLTLAMQIHGLKYETEASVEVNNSGWQPINSSTVTLLGNGAAYGGIGGGFHTLQMTMNLPAGAVTTGNNTIAFRFNGTDGRVSGFRVLAVNVQTASGSSLIPAANFLNDDPSTWQAPSTLASDISAGETLWRTAALTTPSPSGSGSTPIQAHCMDCHTQDGRDLKYFNYSNNSIEVRSMFHGLTAQQGAQIASYIRSLNVPNPGRPWNPPYQPGPGLDEQPVASWAAGAGIGAVLNHDADMLAYLMPGGSSANWGPNANLNAREMPITMQLPDWNSWLPSIHPKDAWPSSFTSSRLYANYLNIRANLVPNNAASYTANQSNIWNWTQLDHFGYMETVLAPQGSAAWSKPQYVQSLTSLEMWSMTKLWEINQEFGLEGMSQTAFGPQADPRAWYSPEPFFVAPLFYVSQSAGGIGNGLQSTWKYIGQSWWQLQLILNASNNRGTHLGPSADFGYVYANLFHLSAEAGPQGLLMTTWLIKGLQASQNGLGPQVGSGGWGLYVNDPTVMVWWGPTLWDPNLSAADRQNVMQTYLSLWLAQASQYTPQDFYTGTWTTANVTTTPLQPSQGGYNDDFAYMIPRFGYYGVSSTVLNQVAAWSAGLWPNYNWAGLLKVSCSATTPDLTCTQ